MKVMIVCRETHTGGSGEEIIRAMINDTICGMEDAPGSWTLSTYHSDGGASLHLISASSASSAALLADAIRRSGNTLDVNLWQELDSGDLLPAFFP